MFLKFVLSSVFSAAPPLKHFLATRLSQQHNLWINLWILPTTVWIRNGEIFVSGVVEEQQIFSIFSQTFWIFVWLPLSHWAMPQCLSLCLPSKVIIDEVCLKTKFIQYLIPQSKQIHFVVFQIVWTGIPSEFLLKLPECYKKADVDDFD